MNKKVMIIIAVVAIVGVAVAVVALGSNKTSAPTKPQESTNQSTNETSGEKADVTITYTNNGFEPANLEAKAGDVVKVVNNSSSSLQFSSDDHPTHTHDPELNQATQAPGQSVTFTLNRTGEWGFHNHLNASHAGTINVK